MTAEAVRVPVVPTSPSAGSRPQLFPQLADRLGTTVLVLLILGAVLHSARRVIYGVRRLDPDTGRLRLPRGLLRVRDRRRGAAVRRLRSGVIPTLDNPSPSANRDVEPSAGCGTQPSIHGARAIADFFGGVLGRVAQRPTPTWANGRPAVLLRKRGDRAQLRAHRLLVLDVDAASGRIGALHAHREPAVLTAFGG